MRPAGKGRSRFGEGSGWGGSRCHWGRVEVGTRRGVGGRLRRGINVLRFHVAPHWVKVFRHIVLDTSLGSRDGFEDHCAGEETEAQRQVPGFPTHPPKRAWVGVRAWAARSVSGGRHTGGRRRGRVTGALARAGPFGDPELQSRATVTVPGLAGGKKEVVAEQGQGLAFRSWKAGEGAGIRGVGWP